jgi:hypothetical protein
MDNRSSQETWSYVYDLRDYDPNHKADIINSLVENRLVVLDDDSFVLDVGSGNNPISLNLPSKPKIITLDLAGQTGLSAQPNHTHLKTNAETLPTHKDDLEILTTLCRSLSHGKEVSITHLFQLIVFSEILNYVDYRSIIAGYSRFLDSNGQILIINSPNRGFHGLFSPQGVKNNQELIDLMQKNFVIDNISTFKIDNIEMLVLLASNTH